MLLFQFRMLKSLNFMPFSHTDIAEIDPAKYSLAKIEKLGTNKVYS